MNSRPRKRRINPAFLLGDRDNSKPTIDTGDFSEKPTKKSVDVNRFLNRDKESLEPVEIDDETDVTPAFIDTEDTVIVKDVEEVSEPSQSEPIAPNVIPPKEVSAPPKPVTVKKVRPSINIDSLLEEDNNTTVDELLEETVKTEKYKGKQVNPLFLGEPTTGNRSRPTDRYDRKMEQNIVSGEWTDDDPAPKGTPYGLGGEIDVVKKPSNKGFRLMDRDIVILRFLARYRYAYLDQVARLVDTSQRAISVRLRKLEEQGLVRKEKVSGTQYLWTTRNQGNIISGIEFKAIPKGQISYVTLAHTIGLANIGAELEREAGGADLLGEGKGIPGWVQPKNRWRMGVVGHPEGKVYGEMTVTEREIRQGQLRWRGNRDTKTMREYVDAAVSNPEGPELEEGNEGLFVVYGAGGTGGEHVPDLVVMRPRNSNGEPENIAIELELTPKSETEWKRILRNYRTNGLMFKKVYYFTHKGSIGKQLTMLAAEEGLSEKFVVRKYIPLNEMPFWG